MSVSCGEEEHLKQEGRTCTLVASRSSELLMVVWRITLWARWAEGVVQVVAVEPFVVEVPMAKRRVVCVVPGR